MTNEEIDVLEGSELDAAFEEAFGPRPHSELDCAINELPDGWRIAIQGCMRDGTGWVATVLPCGRDVSAAHSAMAPDPATALCRAALKANMGP